uniref:Uncharacterized protein n=1 Tax=Psilocybe cubensis TaxID=181762 RepID=A0A8H8CGK5_PSICU
MLLICRIRRHQRRAPSTDGKLVDPFVPSASSSGVVAQDSSVPLSMLRKPETISPISRYGSSKAHPPSTPSTTNYSARYNENLISATSTAPSSKLAAMVGVGNSVSRDEDSRRHRIPMNQKPLRDGLPNTLLRDTKGSCGKEAVSKR